MHARHGTLHASYNTNLAFHPSALCRLRLRRRVQFLLLSLPPTHPCLYRRLIP